MPRTPPHVGGLTSTTSVVSNVKDSQICATTEEYILPIFHGNDRVEWFIQVCDEIVWDVEDGATGRPRAKVIMKAGDVAAMPADIRHKGYSPKRSILIVWENNDSTLPQRYSSHCRNATPAANLHLTLWNFNSMPAPVTPQRVSR